MSTPHDALFKRVFSQPEHAASELRHMLPPDLVLRIDWDTLALAAGNFVDESMREVHADVLYSVRLAGREVLLYVLLEHKSKWDRFTPLQLYVYIGRIWSAFHEQHKTRPLPLVIPIVIHHSDTGWLGTTRLLDIVDIVGVDPDLRAPLADLVPDFRFLLDDLSSLEPEALGSRDITGLAWLTLYCLERSRKSEDLLAELRRVMPEIRRLWQESGADALLGVLGYVTIVQAVPRDEVRQFIADIESAEDGPMTSTWDGFLDEMKTEWRRMVHAEGLAEGLAEGEAEAMARILLRQLEQRFGPLPEQIPARVHDAPVAQIERWIDRVIVAPDLDTIFE
jgi:Putative transposase, YhgA-like